MGRTLEAEGELSERRRLDRLAAVRLETGLAAVLDDGVRGAGEGSGENGGDLHGDGFVFVGGG